MVRASGLARDTRADHPFVGYGLLPMEVHSEQGCDVISRLKVRINEVYTALNMIDYGLDNLPGGPLMVEGFTKTRRWTCTKRSTPALTCLRKSTCTR